MRVRLLVTVSVLALLAAACTGSTAPASTPDTTDRAIAAETLVLGTAEDRKSVV